MRAAGIPASVCVLAIMMAIAPQRVAALAPASTCPQIWSFSRVTSANRYALTLRANSPTTTDVTIKIRAGSDGYVAELPAVAIDQGTDVALVPYRSNVIVLPDYTNDEAAEILVSFRGTSSQCPDEARSIKPDLYRYRLPVVDYPLGVYATLADRIAAEARDATPITMYVDPNPPAVCPEKDTVPSHVAPLQYPAIARDAGVTGTVSIVLDIDRTGNIRRTDVFHSSGNASLDEAARAAALSATYESATIACIATASTYLFRSDFAQQ